MHDLVMAIGIPSLVLVALVTFMWRCSPIRRRAIELFLNKEMVHSKPSMEVSIVENHYTELERIAQRNKRDKWELPPSNLVIHELEILGHGAFSNVYKGTVTGKVHSGVNKNIEHGDCDVCPSHQKEGRLEAAVKRLPAHASEQDRLDFFGEIDFMKRLGYHVHIISMLGCVSDPRDPLILVEYCHHGDMLKFLRSRRTHLTKKSQEIAEGIRIKDLVSFAWQISDGMTYLSSKNFVHRDLAARNVLLTKGLVSDFGMCRYINSALYTAKAGKVPIKWMAIESLKFYEYSVKSDVWAYGVCLFEIFSMGEGPYQTIQPLEMLKHLENGNRLERSEKCPHEIYTSMQQCWKENASERPTFVQIRDQLTKLLNLDDEHYGYLSLPVEHKWSNDTMKPSSVLSNFPIHGRRRLYTCRT